MTGSEDSVAWWIVFHKNTWTPGSVFLLSTTSLQPKCFTTIPLIRSRVGFAYHKRRQTFFVLPITFFKSSYAFSAFNLHCSVVSVSLLTCFRAHWMNLFREAVLFICLCVSSEAQEWAKCVSRSKLNDPTDKLVDWIGILKVTRYVFSYNIVFPGLWQFPRWLWVW